MSERPTATALAVTQRFDDASRSLHFATDRGPVVVRIDDASVLADFGEMLTEEAGEWLAESGAETGAGA